VITTADNSGILNLQSGGNTIATVQSTGFSLPTSATINAANTFGFENRIINGGMTIDQRNAGASVTPTTNSTYTLDRWRCGLTQSSKFSVQQTTTAPAGFINSLKVTSTSAYTLAAGDIFLMSQFIEGLNVSDLGWGTANAKTITLSFRVYSSLTGTFGGALGNSAANRSYPFTYTISTANTWTTISVTIAGDTSGTWLTTNGTGIAVYLGLGVGTTYSGTASAWAGAEYYSATGAVSVVSTNAATWYVTGVQLEVGSQATSFDFRSIGQELALCQRYYQQWDYSAQLGSAGATAFAACKYSTTDSMLANAQLICAMRTAPTLTCSNATARAVLNTGAGTTVNLSTFYTNGLGSLVMTFSNNSLAAGFGWVDGIGILRASSEL
jgi:hypothetical protein